MGVEVEKVFFNSVGGDRVPAVMVATGTLVADVGVVFVQDQEAEKSRVFEEAKWLAERGVPSFVFDLPSQRPLYKNSVSSLVVDDHIGLLEHAIEDCQSAIEILKSEFSLKKVVVIAQGLGVTIAPAVDHRYQSCAGLILIGGNPKRSDHWVRSKDRLAQRVRASYPSRVKDFVEAHRPFDATENIVELKKPILFQYAVDDPDVPFGLAEELYSRSISYCKSLQSFSARDLHSDYQIAEYRKWMKEWKFLE